jgi:hypothetical protein
MDPATLWQHSGVEVRIFENKQLANSNWQLAGALAFSLWLLALGKKTQNFTTDRH